MKAWMILSILVPTAVLGQSQVCSVEVPLERAFEFLDCVQGMTPLGCGAADDGFPEHLTSYPQASDYFAEGLNSKIAEAVLRNWTAGADLATYLTRCRPDGLAGPPACYPAYAPRQIWYGLETWDPAIAGTVLEFRQAAYVALVAEIYTRMQTQPFRVTAHPDGAGGLEYALRSSDFLLSAIGRRLDGHLGFALSDYAPVGRSLRPVELAASADPPGLALLKAQLADVVPAGPELDEINAILSRLAVAGKLDFQGDK